MANLTRQDLRALKHADSITLHYAAAEQRSQVRAHLDRNHSSTGFDQTHDIEAPSRVTWYVGDNSRQFPPSGRCFASIHWPQGSLETLTWLNLLREGDELELHWLAGNTNQSTRDAGLEVDECWLVVKRPKTNRQMKFHIDTLVCPPDSTARMCNPYR